METFNPLFESGESRRKKVDAIEQSNIVSLQESNSEIEELLKQAYSRKEHKVIYVHDTSSYLDFCHFPVEHKIVKSQVVKKSS